ncbi:hypothetical protein MRB53_028108 [Persea americana]|uniref:Uncharacterized protein n=1 Tax=Persea americana TaxID=3435 RepID=A0ACC2KEP0_PERAE|nr:hypothetical protein MRB53_028108 [Persea americana]
MMEMKNDDGDAEMRNWRDGEETLHRVGVESNGKSGEDEMASIGMDERGRGKGSCTDAPFPEEEPKEAAGEPQRHLCYSQVLMGKREKTYLFVRLVSAAGTGFFYVARKSRKGNMAQQKLEFRKYDPRVNRHVLFTEAKMK